MDVTRRRAARLRGLFVGAVAAASALAGHALGGAALPGGTSIVLVVLCSAGVGAVASAAAADSPHRVVAVLAYLSAGQLVGHYLLQFSGGHQHAHGWSAPMATAHALAAGIAAVLICTAERLFAALAAAVWQLMIVLLMPADRAAPGPSGGGWWIGALTLRTAIGRGRSTRAPPTLVAA